MENTLKPGYIIKLRGKFYAVDSVEGLTYDLVVTAQGNTNGTEVSDAYDSGYFEDEDLERAIHGLRGREGFEVEAHEVTLRGTCARCR